MYMAIRVPCILQELHQTLIDGYKMPNGVNAACSNVAEQVSRSLIVQGQSPRLLFFRGQLLDSEINRKPLRFAGREWGAHVVAAVGDTVFDPLSGKPLKVRKYMHVIFGETAEVREIVSAEEISEWMKRGSESE